MSDPRSKLLAHIARFGDINDPDGVRPLVALEEFFQGNDDLGSIGYNFYPDQPTPSEFFSLFRGIRARDDVADVRVEIAAHDDPEAWPTSETVWIISSATPADVASWLGERFAADELHDGFPSDQAYEPLTIPEGMRAIGVWWD